MMTFNEFMHEKKLMLNPSSVATAPITSLNKQFKKPQGDFINKTGTRPLSKSVMPSVHSPSGLTRPSDKVTPKKPSDFLKRGINMAPTTRKPF